jgi:hypothetical protein
MKNYVLTAILLLSLAACSGGSDTRQQLAKCKLAPEAHINGAWNYEYVATCMQANKYRFDGQLHPDETTPTIMCLDEAAPELDPACYRKDN